MIAIVAAMVLSTVAAMLLLVIAHQVAPVRVLEVDYLPLVPAFAPVTARARFAGANPYMLKPTPGAFWVPRPNVAALAGMWAPAPAVVIPLPLRRRGVALAEEMAA